MTTTEAKRLMAEIAERRDLAAELAALEGDPKAWWQRARDLGFRLSLDEVEELLAGSGGLDDEDLEAVAGGWEGDGSGDDGSGDGGG